MHDTGGRKDVYQSITDTIVSAIEHGTGNFQMPWHRDSTAGGLPRNAYTGKPYSGVNVISLWVAAERRDYATQTWATYLQWQQLEAQVRKGERATPIVLYKQIDVQESDKETGEPISFLRPRCRAMLARRTRTPHIAPIDPKAIPRDS
jgi:antirestriction protein ArdC